MLFVKEKIMKDRVCLNISTKIIIFLFLLMICSVNNSKTTLADVGPYDSVIGNAYNDALAIANKEGLNRFQGWCGYYVRLQLEVLGIGHVPSGALGNGRDVYGNLTANATTNAGYKQIKYPGNNCLYDIVNDYGNKVENIVISFDHQYGYTSANPGNGHVVFINGIIDSVVYFSESYSSVGYDFNEGTPLKLSLSAFMERYNREYGNAIGGVVFDKDNNKRFHYDIETCVGDGGVIYLKGWVYNSENVTKSIQIHAYLDGGPGSDAPGWAIPADVARTDIDAIYHIGAFHGFEYTIKGITQGQHTLQLFANDQYLNEHTKIGDYSVEVTSDSFVTIVEECRGDINAIYLKGWVYNNNNITNSIQIHAYLDGAAGSGADSWAIPADVSRKDMDSVYKAGEFHGFDYYIRNIEAGNHTVYLYANDQFRDTHEALGLYNIVVQKPAPTLTPEPSPTPTPMATQTPTPSTTPIPTPVFENPDLVLPTEIISINESAFEGIAARIVYISDTCTHIEKWAFRNCINLKKIRIPSNCSLEPDVFIGCDSIILFGTKGSAAEVYANSHSNCIFVEE